MNYNPSNLEPSMLPETSTADAALRQARDMLANDGLYPARLMSSPALFDQERERVFGRAWVYLGHESEIPERGDYMVRSIVDDQFIVARGSDGEIRANHNSCRHRGMQLCRADRGRTARFTCPYHGWTYANTGKLLATPMSEGLYPEAFDKAEWGLRPLPSLGIFHGMIFGSLDPDAMPLQEYLGDMGWYLEMMAARTQDGLEAFGAPQRWVVDADWKLGSDNFVGDAFHTATTHRSMLGGAAPRDAGFAMRGQHIHAGNGHGLGIGSGPEGGGVPPYNGLPEALWPEIERTLSDDQAHVLKTALFIHGTVFPNMSFLQVLEAKDEQSMPTAMLTFRVWHPIAAGKMEIWSWFLVDKAAAPDHKEESYRAYLRTFGSGGGFEADDAENWRSITRATKGQFSEGALFNYQMAKHAVLEKGDWPGPGEAYPLAYAELNQRAFHLRWLDYMIGEI